MLVSTEQQSESARYIHMSTLFKILFPYRSLGSIESCFYSVIVLFSNSLLCVLFSVMSDSLQPQGLYPARLLRLSEFPRHEYWNELPFPPSGHLPNPGIKLTSPVSPALQVDTLTVSLPGSPGHY